MAAAGCGTSPGAPKDACGDCTPAVPETGAVFQAIASGSSYGDKEQVARNGHSNVAVMGEPTPPSADKRLQIKAGYPGDSAHALHVRLVAYEL